MSPCTRLINNAGKSSLNIDHNSISYIGRVVINHEASPPLKSNIFAHVYDTVICLISGGTLNKYGGVIFATLLLRHLASTSQI